MPKLWNDTIDTHRQSVRDATMDATAALVATEGLSAVSMSRIAQDTGIGRATLYKYFPDVDAILAAWHERQVERHLAQLAGIREANPGSKDALRAVLTAYSALAHHGHDDTADLHFTPYVRQAHHRLQIFLRDLIATAAQEGHVRSDVPPLELAAYCLGALGAASNVSGKAATRRLVAVVLAGMAR